MNDAFITAVNTSKVSMDWMDQIVYNMANLYTPGFKEIKANFKTHLDGVALEDETVNVDQGKSFPGTSPENIYLEGKGYFLTKKPDGTIMYTRRGEFSFDGEGVYKSKDGYTVQGYLLNDKGEQLGTPAAQGKDPNTASPVEGGPATQATSDIKLWIDPSNGKYLGKYEEWEIKEDGILYGKAKDGKLKVPLYKIAINNFHNPAGLTNMMSDYYMESDLSGKPVMGRGDVRAGLIELSNSSLRDSVVALNQAKLQIQMSQKVITNTKQLLDQTVSLLNS